MKLNWTVEPHNVILLRCSKGGPRAHVGLRIDRRGYAATILEPGMPGRGPFRFRTQAAQWCEDFIALGGMFKDVEFGPVPPDPDPIREQQQREMEPTLFEWRV